LKQVLGGYFYAEFSLDFKVFTEVCYGSPDNSLHRNRVLIKRNISFYVKIVSEKEKL